MASRPELIQIAIELGLWYNKKSITELKKMIKDEADRLLNIKKIKISADNLSSALKKFLTEEYDYVILDKNGNKLNYMGDKNEN